MSNRRFEMYQYRNVIHRMRMGESDRTIALTKLMGRGNCKQVRLIAEQNGWLGKEPLPDDETLAAAFEIKPEVNPTQGVILGVRVRGSFWGSGLGLSLLETTCTGGEGNLIIQDLTLLLHCCLSHPWVRLCLWGAS